MTMTRAVAMSIQAVSPLSIGGASPSAARARLGRATAKSRPPTSPRIARRRISSSTPSWSGARLRAVVAGVATPGAAEPVRFGGGTGAKRGRSAEDVAVDVGHRLIPDRMVDVVRRGVGDVREQEAELEPLVELGLRRGGDERPGKSTAAVLGRRVDGPDAR